MFVFGVLVIIIVNWGSNVMENGMVNIMRIINIRSAVIICKMLFINKLDILRGRRQRVVVPYQK